MLSNGSAARVRAFSCALVVLSVAPAASAQFELTGTYIQYAGTSATGSLINSAAHSMQYSESGAMPFTCDLYQPGSPVSTFTVEYDNGGGAVTLTNTSGFAAISSAAPGTMVGDTITWTGEYSATGIQFAIQQDLQLTPDERFAKMTVTITNTGTSAINNLYYLRNGDPDFGSCNIGSSFNTDNDVVRQPPTDTSALVTMVAGDGTTPDRTVTLGIGSPDDRARVTATGFDNTDASGEWLAPVDPDGTSGDIGVDISFQLGSLAGGASTTFDIYYVWGPDVATVESRFDSAGTVTTPCTGIPEGGACVGRGGAAGLCRTGRCCAGCWTGTSCQAGTAAATCGVGGALCASCVDTNQCTLDVCTAGVCSNPNAPLGAACDDGMFCTNPDTCNGTGTCASVARVCNDGLTCTADTCNEMTDRCTTMVTTGCAIAGLCVADGMANPGNTCEACNAAMSTLTWSAVPAGTTCGTTSCTSGRLTPEPTCDAMRRCTSGVSSLCPTRRCASLTACEAPCTGDGDCPMDQFCNGMMCVPKLMPGNPCMRVEQCARGFCTDGTCCMSACGGTCETCNLFGMRGMCAPYSAGTDPEMECADPTSCNGAGVCSMTAPRDAGPGGTDAGPPGADAGPSGGSDGSTGGTDAGTRRTATDSGCGCTVPSASRSTVPVCLLALLALIAAIRRRRG